MHFWFSFFVGIAELANIRFFISFQSFVGWVVVVLVQEY